MQAKTREEYEKKINGSVLFNLDRMENPDLYQKERTYFFELLAEYYTAYVVSIKDYGLEFIQVTDDCLKHFNPEEGTFLHYLNTSMRKKLNLTRAKTGFLEERKGIRIPYNKERQIQRIRELAESKNWDLKNIEVQEKIASALKITRDEIVRLLLADEQYRAVSDVTNNEDGEEISIIEERTASKEENAEEILIRKEQLQMSFDDLTAVFEKLQERQKRSISMRITAEVLRSYESDIKTAENILRGRPFLNEELLEITKKCGKVPANKEIAELLEISEQNLSNRYRTFMQRVRSVSKEHEVQD